MVMALRMFFADGALRVVTGYESGLTSVQRLKPGTEHAWETISSCQPHSQPILSLDISLDSGAYFTSAADANIAMASLTQTKSKDPVKMNATKHAGQQGLSVRSDGKIFATAGWDGRMRIYSAKTLKEVAVLKWHKEGCYAVAFAAVFTQDSTNSEEQQALAPGVGLARTDPAEQTLVPSLRVGRITTVRQQREDKTRQTHWLAAGSKDGKVSLWNIF
jgi:WD40 repeat protein